MKSISTLMTRQQNGHKEIKEHSRHVADAPQLEQQEQQAERLRGNSMREVLRSQQQALASLAQGIHAAAENSLRECGP